MFNPYAGAYGPPNPIYGFGGGGLNYGITYRPIPGYGGTRQTGEFRLSFNRETKQHVLTVSQATVPSTKRDSSKHRNTSEATKRNLNVASMAKAILRAAMRNSTQLKPARSRKWRAVVSTRLRLRTLVARRMRMLVVCKLSTAASKAGTVTVSKAGTKWASKLSMVASGPGMMVKAGMVVAKAGTEVVRVVASKPSMEVVSKLSMEAVSKPGTVLVSKPSPTDTAAALINTAAAAVGMVSALRRTVADKQLQAGRGPSTVGSRGQVKRI